MKSSLRRAVAPIVALTIAGLVLGGCASGSATPAGQVGIANGIVKIQGSITGTDATLLEDSWAGWEKANHIRIEYTGSADFEEQIGTEAQEGNAPDLAIVQQPGLIDDLATRGYLQKMPTEVLSAIKANFPAQWAGYTTVNGVDYAAPLLATLNGWVFYSPSKFDALGLKVPSTWAELLTVTEYLRAKSGTPPWCEGFDSDAASGSAGTSWVDDLVLREDGPSVYDQWVKHEIPFSDPRIQKAFDDTGEILQNRTWVNAGAGGVASINTTTTAAVAKALESGQCALTHQSSAFLGELQDPSNGSAVIGPQGDIWAFILPPINPSSTPFTIGGSFVAAFSNDADAVKVQNYLASTAWAKSRMKLGGAISPDKNIIPSDTPQELLNASLTLLQSPNATIRFDASDLMPSVVGEGSYLTGMVNWINGTPTSQVVSTIDSSWPTGN